MTHGKLSTQCLAQSKCLMLSIVIISLEQHFEGSKVSFNQVGVTGRRKSNQILLLEGVCTLHFINLSVKTPEEALRWSFSQAPSLAHRLSVVLLQDAYPSQSWDIEAPLACSSPAGHPRQGPQSSLTQPWRPFTSCSGHRLPEHSSPPLPQIVSLCSSQNPEQRLCRHLWRLQVWLFLLLFVDLW